jgi:two-component system chemotaxis sensor kinase CheA
MSTDPTSGEAPSVFTEFLADYFIECDEHLSAARHSILALEPQLLQETVDRPLLDELFRSFHSLKGLSAMVAFHDAEQLAHQLESFLSAVRKNQVRLEVAGFNVLVSGVTMLEQIIAARRDSTTLPDVTQMLNEVTDLLPRVNSSPVIEQATSSAAAQMSIPSELEQRIAENTPSGSKAWRIQFQPSAELVKRGVDVNAVRQRLQELGQIIHAEPVIGAGGGISFLFVLISAIGQLELHMPTEGITCELYRSRAASQPARVAAPTSLTAEGDSSTHLAPANLVRVDLSRLDELMRLVGELVLSRARLDDGLRRLQSKIPAGEMRALQETNSAIERQLRDLREGVMQVRMVPVREVFARMQFVVRDLMRDLGKQGNLYFSGEETKIDKYVVERIMDPLLHLVRNAVSHGLEPVEARVAAGKDPRGRIDLRARTTGEIVVIEVEDDGRGIDSSAVMARARAEQWVPPDSTPEQIPLLDVLCIPGFSIRDKADRASGRGVGMDVVRRVVEEMGGSLSLETTFGRGTRFIIQLPLTLAITDALIVKVAEQRFAVPQAAVREVLYSDSDQSVMIENNELLRYQDGVLPLLRLSDAFGIPVTKRSPFYALVVGEGVHALGLGVENVLGLREVVVRPLTDRLVKVPGIAGATELGDGRVVLILDVAGLYRMTRKTEFPAAPVGATEANRLPFAGAAKGVG